MGAFLKDEVQQSVTMQRCERGLRIISELVSEIGLGPSRHHAAIIGEPSLGEAGAQPAIDFISRAIADAAERIGAAIDARALIVAPAGQTHHRVRAHNRPQ